MSLIQSVNSGIADIRLGNSAALNRAIRTSDYDAVLSKLFSGISSILSRLPVPLFLLMLSNEICALPGFKTVKYLLDE